MSDLRYLFFIGCTIPYRVTNYEVSARKTFAKLGIELVEMSDFNCCGLPVDPASHEMMMVLAARNLCLAEQQGLDIITLCTGCAGTLRKVNRALKEEKELRNRVNEYLSKVGMEFKGTIEAKHFIHVLKEDVGFDRIKDSIRKPLAGLKVAEHCGCHLLRPTKIFGWDDPENPEVLKGLIELTGAECLDYMDEPECCGYTIIAIDDKVALQLTREKLQHIKMAGAQAMVTVCPSCHLMFDMQQSRIERAFNEKFELPVLHFPQLLGLAMGLGPDELALGDLRVSPSKILEALKIV
ncbi:MAG: CoB--CoM heterodisulfide reductase iron-sulfur subunit B family protein [Candidatus Bathyarchaeota archaeon]|nr:MAG: CoB--CoM heterodisulfide reductase iron-sulfur subunit B family protein [Candidatus Bathyarchaeota archaeon]UCD40458.1 MAG: CoB--CoM heterodisulfide reductase iron-sulfur subunit B family protein [Candidatus Bathyarchaeota archaeon]